MFIFPYIRYIRKILKELEKTSTISDIEIKEFGRRIFIKLGNKKKSSILRETSAASAPVVIPYKAQKANRLMEKIVERQPIKLKDVLLAKRFYLIVTPAKSESSHIWIPRFILINKDWHLIVPVRSPANGTFEYIPTINRATIKSEALKCVPQFLDHIPKKAAIGIITTKDGRKSVVRSPISGNIISFQTLHLQEVTKSRIILLLAMRLTKPMTIPGFFYPSPDEKPFTPPSHPNMSIFVPKVVPHQMGTNVVLDELYPIISQHSGIVHYTHDQLKNADTPYSQLQEHQFLDFITSKEPLAVIAKTDGSFSVLTSPGPAEIGGFQIQNGCQVDPGDIVMIILKKAVS
jgi:hypothetical protein